MTEFHVVDFLAALAVALLSGYALWRFPMKSSQMPQVGQMAPEFTLPNASGAPVALSSFGGQWVVLYFYPKYMTTGCAIEARNFQRDEEKYAALGAVIVGVSLDTVQSHEKFCAKDGLDFTLLSDREDMKVSKEYGVLGGFLGFKMDKRMTFLIDPEGKIAKVWRGVNPMTHSGQVLEELRRLTA